MRKLGQLRGRHVGGWWEPVRSAIWEFAGIPSHERKLDDVQVPNDEIEIRGYGEGSDEVLNGVGVEAQRLLGMPEKIVITYISRQGTTRRRLVMEDHDALVEELKALVDRKNEEAAKELKIDEGKGEKKKPMWELNVLQAEKMSKDEQVKATAKSTVSVLPSFSRLSLTECVNPDLARSTWKRANAPRVDEADESINRDRNVLPRGICA
jgi:hypothetical protein